MGACERLPMVRKHVRGAAEGGHLEVLQWARANGCPWDEKTCWRAAEGGHLEVLQWARTNGCPWNEGTCSAAALGGHLEVLQWARANGCPWDRWTCTAAADEWSSGGAAVGARKRLPVDRIDARNGGGPRVHRERRKFV